MSFLQKAKEAAQQAANQARQPGDTPASGWGQPAASGWQQPAGGQVAAEGFVVPEGEAKSAADTARDALGFAKKGLAGVIDKIDAGTMADIIIKATALQEKTNKALRLKGSPYRIAEISISASLPPAVAFAISRIDDPEDSVLGQELSSTEILADAGVSSTLEVDGAEISAEPTVPDR